MKLPIILMLMFAGITAVAKQVGESAAQSVGAHFLMRKGVAGIASASDITLAYTASTQTGTGTIVNYYVFNFSHAKGFVMVAGDDIIMPILAYSDQSLFDMSNMASSTKDWIDGYKNQITAAITHNVAPKSTTPALWEELKSADITKPGKVGRTTTVSPLVNTTWDQYGGGAVGYNQYCPNTATTSGQSVTGCVATAMAQVMKFWNWPTVGNGYHTYFDTYSTSAGMGSNTWNSADFGNTAYNWIAMPATSSNASVATLMYHCGVSVNMMYSANESGAYVDLYQTFPVNSAEYALKTYFHYSPNLHSILRYGIDNGSSLGSYYVGPYNEYCNGLVNVDSLTEVAWIDTLQAELNLHHPMLYEGAGSAGGHCWVCDGWETTGDMFHFNWGWSGMSDGFYTIDNLAPPALGAGGGGGNFNFDQGVIKGIFPDSFATTTASLKMQSHLDYTSVSSPMQYATPFTLTAKIKNAGTATFTGDFCAQIFDASNTLVDSMSVLPGISIAAGDSTALITFADSGATRAMIPVNYHNIRIAYRASGTTAWSLVANNAKFINYTTLDVMNDTDIAMYDSMHVGSHIIAPGCALTVATSLGNQSYNWSSGYDWSGTLRALLLNVKTGDTFFIQTLTGESVNSGNSINVSFSNSSVTVPDGVYALLIQHDYFGSGAFYVTSSDYFPNPILITVAGTTNVSQYNNSDNVYVFPNPAHNMLNIMPNGTIITNIAMFDVMGHQLEKQIQPNGKSIVTVNVANLTPGVYFVEMDTDNGHVSRKVIINN